MVSSIDLAAAYADSGVAEVLEQLDQELIGLTPVAHFQIPFESGEFANGLFKPILVLFNVDPGIVTFK